MIRQIFAASVSGAALALATPAFAQDEAAERTPPPQMTFGTWGVETSLLDTSIKPGDDFFDYVNGKWIAANPIPPEFSRYGSFNFLSENATTNVEKLITELAASNPPAGSQARRIADAYNAFLDTAAIDARGLTPAQPYLDRIRQAGDLSALTALFAEAGYPSLIGAGVTVDPKDPNRYIVSIGFDGMGMPDRDLYLVDSERNREIQDAYKGYLAFLLGKAGYADPADMAAKIYAFEHQVAELEWARASLRDDNITYNKLTRDELLALVPQFPLASQLSASGFDGQQEFLVPQIPPTAEEVEQFKITPEILDGIGGGTPAMLTLLTATDIDTLKAFMIAQFISNNASVLPADIDDANFAFYGKLLNGQEVKRARWKRAIASTEGMLGEQLGKLYVDRYFPPESKAAMDDLVVNLRKAVAVSITDNTWMTEATKKEAIAKLDAFTPKIGYPDEFETYDGLEITPADPLGNRIRATAWAVADSRSKLGKPVDRTEWGMLPQTVNAYFNPVFNEIVFPAAILQQPFFGPDADPAVNYGGIGAVIGHEIGHGFDDQGAKFDGTGTLRDWWAPEDLAHFTELGNRLAEQYSSYCPYDEGTTCVNGRFTLGENIGDVGGLSLAYRAYRMSLNGQEAPVIDGLTGDQRFFIAWAQVWRSMQREAAGRQRLLTDPHSPEKFRTNGAVRNHDAWYKAFNIQPGDELYLPPEERVHIW
ncbi:MAG TPA: M13 family metallopeptidase [Croceibacterium sp.]|nr:M13 family metallopeptidase [Croceibacterium sp.]